MRKSPNSQPQHSAIHVTIHCSQSDRKYSVLRNGIPVKTPRKRDILLPNRALAEALADEWRNQGKTINPADMPLTALANTALDHTATNRETILDTLISYANHDLLCYIVDKPQELASRQHALWQPIHDWVNNTYTIQLKITSGLTPIPQPPDSLAHLRSIAAAYHDMILTGFGVVVTATGSFLLGLCLIENHIDSQMAFTLSHLEETYHAEQWGKNPEMETRHKMIAKDIEHASHFLRLCRLDDIG